MYKFKSNWGIILSKKCSNYVCIIKTCNNICVFCCQQPYYSLWVIVNTKFTAFLIDYGSQQISHTGGEGGSGEILISREGGVGGSPGNN